MLMNSLKKLTSLQLDDVVVNKVGFKDVESALVTLDFFGGTIIHKCYTSHQEQSNTSIVSFIFIDVAQESHHTTLDSFFHYS